MYIYIIFTFIFIYVSDFKHIIIKELSHGINKCPL